MKLLVDTNVILDITSVDKQIILQSLDSNIPDFEDAIQVFSAKQEAIKTIITRNEADFTTSDLIIYSSESFLNSLWQSDLFDDLAIKSSNFREQPFSLAHQIEREGDKRNVFLLQTGGLHGVKA